MLLYLNYYYFEVDFDIDKFFEVNNTEGKIKEKLREQESKNKTVWMNVHLEKGPYSW